MKLYKVILNAQEGIIFTEEDKFVLKDELKQSLVDYEVQLDDWYIYEDKVEFLLWSHKIPKDAVTTARTKLALKYKSIHQNCKRLWKASYYIES